MRVGRQRKASSLQARLVDDLKRAGVLTQADVEGAMRAVPRHLFLPDLPLGVAYSDEAIPTKKLDGVAISSSSQPAVMAVMLEQLGIGPGDNVLEIGAGTGYNAALMAHLAGNLGGVVTVDIDNDIVASAREHLLVAGFPNVLVVQGDGAKGYLPGAPYDRIILTVAASDIAPAWIEQLADRGRLLLPLIVAGDVQKLIAFERGGNHLGSVSIRDGSFMALRGSGAGPETRLQIGAGTSVTVGTGATDAIDPEAMYALLEGESIVTPTSISVTPTELLTDASLWLVLHDRAMCTVWSRGEAVSGAPAAFLAVAPGVRVAAGLFQPDGLALLTCSGRDLSLPPSIPFRVSVSVFGDAESTAERLMAHLRGWEAAGRPSSAGMRVRAYGPEATPPAEGIRIEKPHTVFVLDWPESLRLRAAAPHAAVRPEREPQHRGGRVRLPLTLVTPRCACRTRRAEGPRVQRA